MKVKAGIAMALTALLASGCSLLNPYEEDYACPAAGGYGKCLNMEGAYEEAITGEDQGGERITRSGREPSTTRADAPGLTGAPDATAYQSYRGEVYRELTQMLSDPVTPMVREAKKVRTLVLPYPGEGEGRPLYMPRYVYYFADEPQWVLGSYLNDRADRSRRIDLPLGK